MPSLAHRRLGLSLAILLSGTAAFAQEAERDINPAEQLLADILIGMAEVELDLAESTQQPLVAAPAGGDVIDRAKDRVALLESVDPPKAQVVTPPVVAPVDPPVVAAPVEQTPPKPVEPAPPAGTNVAAVSLDGKTVRSLLKSELSETEKAALPAHTECTELGPWFLGLGLQRDHLSFFVREGEFVRACKFLGNSWRVRTAGGRERAHLVQVSG